MSRELKFSLLLMVIFALLPIAVVFWIHGSMPNLDDLSYYFRNVRPSIVSDVILSLFQGIGVFITGVVYVALIIVGSALLFDVRWMHKRIIKSRTLWHVYLGYFLHLILLFSMFASEISQGWHVRLWGTFRAPTLTLFLVLLSLTILACRVVSKLPIKVEDTNLGSFVIVIYTSYAVFRILSQGFDPFDLWFKILHTELIPSYANALFLLSLPAIFAFVLTILDVNIITRIVNGKL